MLITSCGLQRLTVQTTVRSTTASPVHPTGVMAGIEDHLRGRRAALEVLEW